MLSIQLRHGVTAGGALLGAAVILVTLLSETEAWWDNGAAAATLLGEALLRGGLPVTGAFACWLGGTDARHSTRWLSATATRPSLQRLVMQAAPAVLWPLGGYFLVIAVAGFVIPRSAYFGSAPLDIVMSDVALQTMVACLGYALGRAIPLRFTAPLFGLLIPVTVAGLDRVSTAVPQSYRGHGVPGLAELYSLTPPKWLPWLCSALLLVLAATALTVCARRWLLAMLCLLAVVPAALWLATFQEGGRPHQLPGDQAPAHYPRGSAGLTFGSLPFFYRSAPDPVALTCSDSPHVCTAADTQVRVDMEPSYVKEMAERLDGVRGAPSHYVITRSIPNGPGDNVPVSASGRHGGQRWWTVAMSDEDLEFQIGHSQLASQINLFAETIAQDAKTACSKREMAIVSAWLTPSRYRNEVAYAAADAAPLDGLPEARRIAWLSDYFSDEPCKPLPEPSHGSEGAG